MEELFAQSPNCSVDSPSHFPVLHANIFMLIGSIFGVISNGILYVAVRRIEESVGNCNVFVQNLALTDVICCLGNIILATTLLMGESNKKLWRLSQFTCALLSSPVTFSIGAETLLTLLISIDRTIAILNPKMYVKMNQEFARLITITVWLVMVGVALCTVLYAEPNHQVPICIPPFVYTKSMGLWWNGINTVVNIIITGIYIAALLFIVFQKENANSSSIRRIKVRRNNRHLILSLSVILAIHILTWLSCVLIISFIIGFEIDFCTGVTICNYIGVLALFNCNADVFVYYWTTDSFREQIHFLWEEAKDSLIDCWSCF